MTQETLLELCKNRFENKNNISRSALTKNLQEFIAICYLNCDPSSYGKHIMRKIIYDIGNTMGDVSSVADNKNKGDFSICYPSGIGGVKIKVDDEERIIDFNETEITAKNVNKWNTIDCKISQYIKRKFFEGKVSFLGKNQNYQFRNIRVYQDFEYYFFCLIDCEDNFTPRFYVLDKKVLENNFSMCHMNGTYDVISSSGFKNMGFGFKKNSYEHSRLEDLSLLDGTSFDDFISFAKNIVKGLREEFEKTEFFEKIKEYHSLVSVSSTTHMGYAFNEKIASNSEKLLKEFLFPIKNDYPELNQVNIFKSSHSVKFEYIFTNKPSVCENLDKLYKEIHSKFIKFIENYNF